MNFKIIETDPEYPDVLLHRDRDENGSEIVTILAFGFAEDSDDYQVCENVFFDEPDSAQSFIRDYSKDSANKWCRIQNVVYSREHA